MAQFRTFAPAAAEVAHDPIFAREAPYTRIDGAAIAAVTNLYREVLPPGGAILDVMSGWVPHLAPEAPYRRVVGIGIERRALAENPFLDEWRVQDLNRNPFLPFAASEFDGATICAAIQYLARPAEVLRDIARVLRPGAPLIVTFSNRCVATKAIGCWCLHDETGTAVPCRAAFRRGRQLGRHTLSRPHPAGRRPAALCRDRAQPRRRSARTERLSRAEARE